MSTRQQTEEEEKNIKIVRRSIEALNTGDITNVSEFIHPNYSDRDSQSIPGREKLRGSEAFVDTVKKLRAALSELHYKEQEIIASNDKVVSIMIVTGKHTDDLFGIPPTGNNFSYQAAHFYTIADDKIAEHKAFRDDLSFMIQLGVIGAASPQYEPVLNAWKGMMRDKSVHERHQILSDLLRTLQYCANEKPSKGARQLLIYIHRYKVENAGLLSIIYIYLDPGSAKYLAKRQDTCPIVRFSEFLGIGYFGDKEQRVIAPIFDLHFNTKRGWEKVMANQQQEVPIFHTVFVEHPTRYELIAYPIEMSSEMINYAIYRSSSSLSSLNKFKSDHGSGRTYIKFGQHDLTKQYKFDVLPHYAAVDSIEFIRAENIKPGMLVDQIRKSQQIFRQ